MESETYPELSEAGPRSVRDRVLARSPRPNWISILRTGSVFAVVGVIWLVFWQLTPFFLTQSNLYNIGIQASNLSIIAAGLTIVLIAAEIDLSIGAIQALTGSVAAILIIHHGQSPWLGIAAALVVGALAGAVNGLVTWKLRIPSFIATLAMLGIAQGVAYVATSNSPINGFPNDYLNIGTGRVIGNFPVPAIIAIGLITATDLLLNHTRIGRHIYAVGGNAEAAMLSGIAIGRVKLIALVISGFLAGVGGIILSSRLNAGSGDFGTEDLLPAVAAVVIGGTSLFGGSGSVWGTTGGVLLLTSITNGLILLNIQSQWQQIVVGLIILGAMLLDQLLKAELGQFSTRVPWLRRTLKMRRGASPP
jgi:ribose/xylose/arabinose/galactoside ABC-type transport system permease subunit